jgi:hypothetical protein
MNREDTERLKELKMKIWRHQACRLLQGKKNHNEIFSSEIEGHKGRQPKALRLLTDNGYIRYTGRGTTKTKYGSDHDDSKYEIFKFDEESAQFGMVHKFRSTWHELLPDIFSGAMIKNDDVFNLIGYVFVPDLCAESAIYIWWHKEDYDFERDADDSRGNMVYPKALQDTRIKAILRAMVDRTLHVTYHNRLETLLGLPQNSLPCIKGNGDPDEDGDPIESLGYKVEEHTGIRYRNCGFTPTIFDAEHTKGLRKEYEFYTKYFATITDALLKFDEKVKAAGGYAPLIKQMRQTIIQEIIDQSPLNINTKKPEDRPEDEDAVVKGSCARFMLKHGNFFDYDVLYKEDTTLLHITDRDWVQENYTSQFVPDVQASKMVAHFRKEMLDAIYEGGPQRS